MSNKLINSFEMNLTSPECSPLATWYRVEIKLKEDISPIFPYLNAELKGYEYYHEAKILMLEKDSKRFALRPYEILIASVSDLIEGQKLADYIISIINGVWARRSEIKPDFKGKKSSPQLLEIYKLLPGTNCKECGFQTCLAFSSALRNNLSLLKNCPYISPEACAKLTMQNGS